MNTEKKLSNLKPIISISEMCKLLSLSRARFYQLLEQGIFPPPLYQLKTHRPYFDAALQKKLLEIRNSGIGFNGEYLLFYCPRNNFTKKSSRKKQIINPQIKDLTDTLNQMGLVCSYNDVSSALEKLYPEGTERTEQGVILREIFRFLKAK